MRNQIAHGHVGNTKQVVDDVIVMEGNFLLPSLNEAGHQVMRDYRYAHTAAEIDAWRDQVRDERARIMDAELAAVVRAQNSHMAMSSDDLRALSIVEAISEGRIPISGFEIKSRPAPGDHSS
ncbi:hypothetical protein CFHF_26445 [Caulobacter flavus]|uniref:Uncharacterized protein n=2 Tax=Caulobacter flavus TaxID=1679497 RepID=A0A2N5CKJ6_9CAUL|nr:hypothetical protein C1707_15930 [Caulobacter flavus]PLR05933.1 hypothetical protein CFHF_26445 [Caulobacter flavus]